MILHGKSDLRRLLIHQLHLDHSHIGPTALMGILSRDYYFLGARTLVRSISRNYVTCQKTYARTSKQIMGDLPAERIQPSPPFSKTGIDFAGPLTMKRGYTREQSLVKAYVAVFVCLSTKAVHLELVADLSVAAFLATFRRFVARRGCPEELLTDNGTNFVGANHELCRICDMLEKEDAQKELSTYFLLRRISWRYIPGRAPNFGGLWESAVKSAQSLLKKLLGDHTLTTEEFQTVLTEVEADMNSRPLHPIEPLPDDGMEVLTAGHFLIGRPLRAVICIIIYVHYYHFAHVDSIISEARVSIDLRSEIVTFTPFLFMF